MRTTCDAGSVIPCGGGLGLSMTTNTGTTEEPVLCGNGKSCLHCSCRLLSLNV